MRPPTHRPALGLVALLALLPLGAPARGDDKPAGGPKPDPKAKDAPKEGKADAYAGPEIAWARSFAEAKEEAAERNVAMFLHSHGST